MVFSSKEEKKSVCTEITHEEATMKRLPVLFVVLLVFFLQLAARLS
jgi:hypothetical protein